MSGCVLGIDIGTTGTKAGLFDENGRLTDVRYQGYESSRPAPGLCEQNPEDWWQAAVSTVRFLVEKHEVHDRVAAISLSTQGGTVFPADASGKPLRPAIVWSDGRCVNEKKRFQETFGEDYLYRTTGWHLGTGLPLLNVRWLRDHEPEIMKNASMIMTVPDYMNYRLTGAFSIDHSNAGINQFSSVEETKYVGPLMEFAGIDEKMLPALAPSGTPAGTLTKQAAEALGLREGVLVLHGAHDQYAAALGAGAMKDGDMLIGSGTCWVVTALSKALDFKNGLSESRSAVPGIYGSIRSLEAGGACLKWLQKNVLSSEHADFETIDREAAKRPAAEDGLFFFPETGKDGSGLLTRSCFSGISLSHDRYHLARAVMEGVSFQLKWMLEEFPSAPSPDGILLSGGASKSGFWSQITSDILGLPVKVPDDPDLPCFGAAMLAAYGAGETASLEEAVKRYRPEETVVHPSGKKETYQKAYQLYQNYAAHAGASGGR